MSGENAPSIHPNCRCSTVAWMDEKEYEEWLNEKEDIVTDEVVITDNQIQHIKDRHPNDYERFSSYFGEIVKNPGYIIEANKPDTAVILKEIIDNGEKFQMVLRMCTSKEPKGYKNSIITFLRIDEKRWNRYLRTKKILYKKE